MIGKLVGAAIGKKLAGRNSGAKGMLLGAVAPMIVRRAFGPLGFALAGGYVAKKYYDSRKRSRNKAHLRADI